MTFSLAIFVPSQLKRKSEKKLLSLKLTKSKGCWRYPLTPQTLTYHVLLIDFLTLRQYERYNTLNYNAKLIRMAQVFLRSQFCVVSLDITRYSQVWLSMINSQKKVVTPVSSITKKLLVESVGFLLDVLNPNLRSEFESATKI